MTVCIWHEIWICYGMNYLFLKTFKDMSKSNEEFEAIICGVVWLNDPWEVFPSQKG